MFANFGNNIPVDRIKYIMKITFDQFKKKDVIDVASGKKLGKVKDLTFTYPDGRIQSVNVCGGILSGESTELAFCKIEKIGEDAVLIRQNSKNCLDPPLCPPRRPPHQVPSGNSRAQQPKNSFDFGDVDD